MRLTVPNVMMVITARRELASVVNVMPAISIHVSLLPSNLDSF